MGGRKYRITAGAHEADIVEVGAGLQSYRHQGAHVTCTYADDVLPPKACGATLVPWPNRLRGGRYTFDSTVYQTALTEPAAGNAIHGLGRWERWQEVEHTPEALTLRLDIVPQTGYPFPVRVDLTYSLDARSGLTVRFTAENRGDVRAPFGAGSHPYLSCRGHDLDDVTLHLPAARSLVVDEAQVPVDVRSVSRSPLDFRRGKRLRGVRMDHGFTGLSLDAHGTGHAELRTKSGGARLWFDAQFRFLQVFTVEDLGAGESGIAIEPMTCAPDAFNSGDGLIVLEPGQRWEAAWGIAPI